MSHSCTSDVVPFIVHNICESQDGDDEASKMICPEVWVENFGSDEQLEKFDETGECDIGLIRGWRLVEVAATLGKRGRLYGNKFEKDGNVVFVLNESQYNNVGEYEMSVAGNDRESIHVFLKDFNDMLSDYGRNHAKIEEMDSAEQWG
jgi:hypothetical protein